MMVGFERYDGTKFRWVGRELPDDPAPEVYQRLIGCLLSRFEFLVEETAIQNQPIEMQLMAREYVEAWWAGIDGIAVDSARWYSRLRATFDDRFRDGEPSVSIWQIAGEHHRLGGAASQELWCVSATKIATSKVVGPIALRWREARYPDGLVIPGRGAEAIEALQATKRLQQRWLTESRMFVSALPTTRVLNEQFERELDQVLAGVGLDELREGAKQSARQVEAVLQRALQLEFPGPDQPFEAVLQLLAQLDD